MGMFDTVVVESLKIKLPKEVDTFLKKNNASVPSEYQTKDLDSFLNTYTVDKNGQIWSEQHVPTGRKIEQKNPFEAWKDNRSFLERLYFKKKYKKEDKKLSRLVAETKIVKKKEKLTATFNIYTVESINGRYLELDLNVEAVNGRVKNVTLKNYSIESKSKSKERNKNDQEFQARMEASFANRRVFTSRWYYPILKETYNPFVFFVRQGLINLLGKLNIVLVRWHGI
jgi:hypothetical protein